jgi:hypothetical protein
MNMFKLAAAGVLLMAAAAPAHAYGYRTCGDINLVLPSNSLTLHSSDVSFPAGYWQDGLNDGINEFNKNPSNFYYTRVSDSNGLGLGNGESEVWGSTDPSILQGAPAIAYSYWDCYWFFGYHGNMTEGDVIFDYNAPFQWTATTQKWALFSYSGSGRLLQGTEIHELGHAAGLLHENRTYNVMGTDFTHLHTNGTVSRGYVGEDAGMGDVFLYGLWASGPQDLGVAHWRYTGANGQYSTHGRTRVFDYVSGAELPGSIVAGEPRYNVSLGRWVKAEFTYENLGRSDQSSINVRWYLSLDDTITTSDQLLASSTFSLTRDWASTIQRALRIPKTLLRNHDYWIGVVVNANGAIAESDRANNATYIGIHTN